MPTTEEITNLINKYYDKIDECDKKLLKEGRKLERKILLAQQSEYFRIIKELQSLK